MPAIIATTRRKEYAMNEPSAPYHAHVYYEPRTRAVAERLHQQLDAMRANGVLTDLLFVGEMRDKNVGPHPKPQFEVHFLAAALKGVIPLLSSSGLTILVHPLTQDDVADHTTLAQRTRTNHLTITSSGQQKRSRRSPCLCGDAAHAQR